MLCSHDILASKRDHVACSVVLRGSFPPGVSSESATTSINNKSYSGTVQRSDDVTVDSTVSGKRTIKFSLHKNDAERHTDDSSTSQLSFKRKLADRSTFAGKQLPHRSTSVASRNSAEDGDKKSKPRKVIHSVSLFACTCEKSFHLFSSTFVRNDWIFFSSCNF